MSFTFVKQLPSPDQIKAQTPMSEEMKKIKAERDRLIQDVITGKSDKFLVIVGPCSADNEDSVCEYTNRLAKVQDKVADRLVLVPRIYTNKPRTTGEGYKGMLHQPDPEAQPDVMAGILAIRHMHMRSISETGLTSADEMLYPDNWHYLSDLLSYVAIGARSVEKPGTPSDGQWSGHSGRYEESYQRRLFCYAELCSSCPGRTRLYLQRMGSKDRGQSPDPYDPERSGEQTWQTPFPIITMRICSCFWKCMRKETFRIRQ